MRSDRMTMAPTARRGPGRVVWTPDERRSLAQKVAKGLIRQGLDVENGDPKTIEAAMMPLLREAVETFDRHRRRYNLTPSGERDWLLDTMRDMVRASRGEPSRFRPDVLTSPLHNRPEPEPDYGQVVAEYVFPEDCTLVKTEDWENLRGENRATRREQRRLRRAVKAADERLSAQIAHLDDQVTTLIDLILEGRRPSPDETPEAPAHAPVRRSEMPLVVVAGLRGGEHDEVRRAVGPLAEVVFHDASRKAADRVGGCDWLVATRACGRKWLDAARRAYPDRLSVVANGAAAAAEVVRLRGGV